MESLTTGLVLAYAAVALGASAYPPGLGVPRERRSFRVLFAATALGSLGCFVAVPSLVDATPGRTAMSVGTAAAVGWLTVSAVAFLWYLSRVAGWSLAPADGQFVGAVAFVTAPRDRIDVEASLHEAWATAGWRGWVRRGLAVGVVGAVAALPGVVAGLVMAALLWAYPLPDLLVLGWLAVTAVPAVPSRRGSPVPRRYDVEARLYDVLSASVRSGKGAVLTTCLVGTAGIFVGAAGANVDLLAGAVGAVVPAVVDDPVLALAPLAVFADLLTGRAPGLLDRTALFSVGLGLVALTAAASAYAAWACLRELARIGPHLDARGDGAAVTAPPRPVGFVFPGIAGLTPFFTLGPVWIAVARGSPPLSVPVGALLWFGAGWPVAVAALVGCWLLSRRRDPMPVVNEDHLLVWTVVAVALWACVVGAVPLGMVEILDGVALVVAVGYLFDVNRYATRHDDARRFATAVYLSLVGLVVGAVSALVGQLLAPLAGVVLVGAGVVDAVLVREL